MGLDIVLFSQMMDLDIFLVPARMGPDLFPISWLEWVQICFGFYTWDKSRAAFDFIVRMDLDLFWVS